MTLDELNVLDVLDRLVRIDSVNPGLDPAILHDDVIASARR